MGDDHFIDAKTGTVLQKIPCECGAKCGECWYHNNGCGHQTVCVGRDPESYWYYVRATVSPNGGDV